MTLGIAAAPNVRGADNGPVVAGCRRGPDGGHRFTAVDETGQLRLDIALPARGHGACMRPETAELVVIARRPGDFALVVDVARGTVTHRLRAPASRHFYGHGVFSGDGSRLFTSENDFGSGRGVIGVYDAGRGYRRLGEFPSHGTGPHEIRLLPDRRTLVVANGGIRTHPDTGRAKLNLDGMRPSLVLIDARSGRLLRRTALSPHLHRLSIRHLDVAGDGRVVMAMQHEGELTDRVPLLAVLKAGDVRLLASGTDLEPRARNYVGSVAFDRSATLIAATHPRGGLVSTWSAHSATLLHVAGLPDVSGVAATDTAGEFRVSGNGGMMATLDAERGILTAAPSTADGHWDNHLATIPRT